MDQILAFTDSSFKYILLAFNLMSFLVVFVIKKKMKIKKQHHILFVIAHPDDQVMFFRPTIRGIQKDYFIHILCFSAENQQRKMQFEKSMTNLEIYKHQCLQKQNFIDGQNWNSNQVREQILKYIKQNGIKAIFTFDKFGVSNHQNHKSIYQSLKFLELEQNQIKKLNSKNSKNDEQLKVVLDSSIKIYYLNSVNIIRKYSGMFQVLFGLLRDYSWMNLNLFDAFKSLSLHKSQYVWFRKLWVIFSQYNYLNVYSLSRINIKQTFDYQLNKKDQSNQKEDLNSSALNKKKE